MKKWLSYIISVTIACLCYSCSGEEDLSGTSHDGSGNNEGIVIRLGITSRADGGSSISGADNKTITNLKVWMVNEEDDTFSFYKEINDAGGIDFNENDIYNFEMEISLLNPGKYGFYILANSNHISGITFDKNTKPADLRAAYFTEISGGNEAQVAIPMYGEYHSVEILSGVVDYYVQVPLVRMLAKLELFFAKAEEASQLEITSLRLAKIPNKGYIVPRTDWTEVTYDGTAPLLDAPVEITSHSADFAHANFGQVDITRPYIFENPNGGNDAVLGVVGGNAYQLTIDYKLNGKEETQAVTLPTITRNTHYQLYARLLDKTKKFALSLNVTPWELIETVVDFTDVVTYSVTGWTDGTYRQITGDNEVYMKRGNTPAEFKFGIDAPKDCEYMVALSNSVDFGLIEEKGTDGMITVKVSAENTDEKHETSLSVFAKTNGRWVELDVTASGEHTSADEGVKRYTIIQNWN